ncbi:ferric iron reductase [Paenibacillus sp. FSL H7-0331]|uniref:ferric iron reductase n=1 Tax=Paenibacillus sp. FSL H7-0331 TaxID=1920421 RepID=UPI00096DE0B5|nr:ferric iron reductase [Paenibacillus sp. FSL H7-0331]OMF04901.1 hypothetical protein BK127_33100 [Paenibacillus sp. FSL H7-0331]
MGKIDFDYLEKHMYFVKTEVPEALFRLELADLLDKGNAERLIAQYGPVLKAMKPEVASTYFSLWFAWVCAALQYTISHHDAAYNMSLHNLSGQVHLVNNRPRWAFHLHDSNSLSVPCTDRNDWRKRVLSSFYTNEVAPLMASISAAVGINVGQLWGQLATRLHYAYDAWQKEAETDQLRHTIEEDFTFLRYGLAAEIFGRKKNPFDIQFRHIDNPRIPGETMRIKASCCLAYLTDTGHGYCYSCPRMGEEERMEQRMKIEATLMASGK